MLSPLQLAYIGDAVYELLVRTYLLNIGLNVNELHKSATKYVKSKAQADITHSIEEILTDEEKSYIKRGRNAKIHSSPKNADILEYKYATGFECLFGYLFLTGEDLRMKEIFDRITALDIK
ncbi:Mini-ribonuclease 3 [Paratissierella segnis]|nr:ribonuclease III domain-containing protein [Paratissierella segnis]